MLSGAKRVGPRKLFALTEPANGGTPMILTGEASDYDVYIKNVPGNAGRITVHHRAAAIVGILEHFVLYPERVPTTLCLNCFTCQSSDSSTSSDPATDHESMAQGPLEVDK